MTRTNVDASGAGGETGRDIVERVCHVINDRVVRDTKRSGRRCLVAAGGFKMSNFLAPEEGPDGRIECVSGRDKEREIK